MNVQSALGETLKAEIEVPSLSNEEASTLKVRIAPAEVYRSSGVEFNPVLSGAQVQLVRGADGRAVLRLSGERAVQEPFVDVILELSSSSGNLVREYTMLFDPPTSPRQPAPAVVAVAPEASPVPAAAPAPQVAAAPVQAPAPVAAPPHPVKAEPEVPKASEPKAPKPVPKQEGSQYTVKSGDSLSRIASKTQPVGLSLDQMLVALYRGNSDAFIGGNMNRLKAGAVLQVPGSDEVGSTSDTEAHQVIAAQSADYEAFRQRLAGAAPALKAEPQNERQAKGQVQAAVEDHKPAPAATPDKLTLSKAGAASEVKATQASKAAEKKDAAARVAELTRNVEELKKLSSAAKPGPTVEPAASGLPSTAASSIAPAVVAAVPMTAPSAASRPKLAASTPRVVSKPAPGIVDQILDSPLVLPLAALVIAALGGLGLRRMRRRTSGSTSKPDTGFHESRLQPDSFFGNAGGQRVDTRDSNSGSSSMSYSLSQLDAIGDVDPVAEADVYLAYGRDLQAEEILKEALRATPERMAIRLKLLEVYAKRRDGKGFEQLASHLYADTQGQGEDWAKAQELGRQIDPDNPLYQPGGAPTQLNAAGLPARPEPMDASTLPHTLAAGPGHLPTEIEDRAGPVSQPMDLDLDLDLGGTGFDESSVTTHAATQAMEVSIEQAPMEMDFDLSKPPTGHVPAPSHAAHADNELAFDLGQLDLPNPPPPAAAPGHHAAESDGALDFDLSSIDLNLPEAGHGPDLGAHKPEPIPAGTASEFGLDLPDEFAGMPHPTPGEGADSDDPLVRQLELADEFRQIGDTEGARDVLKELLNKASGPLKAKAQAMLNELK